MKGIVTCAHCAYYDMENDCCERGASVILNPTDSFFADCPLDDVEPVVRCEHCVHYRETKDWDGKKYNACHLRADLCVVSREPDDYCSRGERR